LYNERANQGKTPLILFTKQEVLGLYAVADTVKASAIETIAQLKKMGITPVMITGDHQNTANTIATQVGIDQVYAQVKPEEKAEVIQQLKNQLSSSHSHNDKDEGLVAMLGDGINDAPALATADIGIAMSTGTDVAIESSDITLLHGDISKVLKAIEISNLTQSAINQNLLRAFGYNLIGIPLAAGAFFPLF
jgi:Cu+-exporting ATPase